MKKIIVKKHLPSDYNITAAYANITGLFIVVPKDGFYKIISFLNYYHFDIGSTASVITYIMAVDGSQIGPIQGTRHSGQSGAFQEANVATQIIPYTYLKKGQVVTVQVKHEGDDESIIYSDLSRFTSYLEIEGS